MIAFDGGRYYYWQVEAKDLIFQGDSVFSDTFSIAIVDLTVKYTLVPLKEITSIANTMSKKFGNSVFGCRYLKS